MIIRYYIGVDPGLSGATSVFVPATLHPVLHVYDMPILTAKRRVDAEALAKSLQWIQSEHALAVVEGVHSMPEQGVASTFSFGCSFGIVIGVLGALKIPMLTVPAAVWKARYGLTRDKKQSIALAKKVFPGYAHRITSDGRAESSLLAHYGQKYLGRLSPKGMGEE